MDLTDLLADLADAFPRNNLRDGTISIYTRELQDLPLESLEVAVRGLIRSSEFFPTVRAIREVAAEQILGLPDETDALVQIDAGLRWRRTTDEVRGDQEGPVLHPLVREALDCVGGFYALRHTERPEVVRGQLVNIYKTLRLRAIRDVQVDVPAIEAGRDAVYRDMHAIEHSPRRLPAS